MFKEFTPPSPVLKLLRFSVDKACSSLFEVHQDLPHPDWVPAKPTVVIVPGRRPNNTHPIWVSTMAWELLSAGQGNVLAADWMAPPEQELPAAASEVGKKLAQTIQQLMDMGSSPDTFHVIGFGVGAHVAGIAGARLHGIIGRITGLDPFAPVFYETNSSLSLDYTDGQYVDVIHTNFNPNEPLEALGFSRPVGHVDFYTGKGQLLPGCPKGLFMQEKYLLCSHYRAHQLFTSSIKSLCQHVAFPCQAVTDFQTGQCTHCSWPGLNVCPEMGFNIAWLPKVRPVPFEPMTAVLDITSTSPYCVTPFLLKLQVGGNTSIDARLFVQLKGDSVETSNMSVSGNDMATFAAGNVYQFMVSASKAGDFKTVELEFDTQRLLYFEWMKRKVTVTQLQLTLLPRDRRLAFQARDITVIENQRTEIPLQKIHVENPENPS
ncbi:lipase member I-like [Chanos chanos]|uniref:Phospholipase A1 member A n=1 Tax=Chanos chanos TaxID=29144 RepID=A0A6J2UP74_CHACN|nr:lipase member I-like [Chanos chanos]